MKFARLVFGFFLIALVWPPISHSQDSSVTASQTGGSGTPPKFLNIVHETLQPGKNSASDAEEAAILRGYNRAKIPAYWIEWESVTGLPEVLALNFFDSFEQAEQAIGALGAALAAHPELAKMQDHKLQANTISVRNVFTLRRDDLSYGVINFAKARLLRLTTIEVRPGYEAEFVEGARNIVAATKSAGADASWAVYEVNAGMPSPTFLYLTPMRSLKEIDAAAARRNLYEGAKADAFQQRLQEIARSAYASTESQIYFVRRELSHVSKEFAAGDPEFWSPPAEPSSGTTATRKPPALEKKP